MKAQSAFLQKWETYVPEGKLDGIRKMLEPEPAAGKPAAAAAAAASKLVPVDQSKIKSISDTTWLAMNEGATRMIENASVRSDAANVMGKMHAEDKRRITTAATAAVAAVAGGPLKKKLTFGRPAPAAAPTTAPSGPLPPVAAAAAPPAPKGLESPKKKKIVIKSKKRAVEDVEPAEEQTLSPSGGEGGDGRPTKMIIVPPQNVLEALPIEDLEQHHARDNQLALFTLNMERASRNAADFVINTPPAVDILAYCAQYKDSVPWYTSMLNAIANDSQYAFPDVPVMCHKLLRTFLRAPTGAERPCFNLDREPMAHERMVHCIAHRMSEERLGKGKGFRLRELILGGNESLSKIPEMCYLCHLWTYLMASIRQRDKGATPEGGGAGRLKLINKFMVIVDKPGEYDGNKMLTSDKVAAGIWGPVPLFNENNYIVSTTPAHEGSIPCFIETDNLFWLTRVSLPLIESSSKKSSSRSDHTLAPSASSNLHH